MTARYSDPRQKTCSPVAAVNGDFGTIQKTAGWIPLQTTERCTLLPYGDWGLGIGNWVGNFRRNDRTMPIVSLGASRDTKPASPLSFRTELLDRQRDKYAVQQGKSSAICRAVSRARREHARSAPRRSATSNEFFRRPWLGAWGGQYNCRWSRRGVGRSAKRARSCERGEPVFL
jgi:hypothetical protein